MRRKLLSIILISALLLSGCSESIRTARKNEVDNESQDNKIVWVMEQSAKLSEKNVEKLNDALKQKGYDFSVEFQYIDNDITAESGKDYWNAVRERLESGKGDIAFCGWEYSTAPWELAEFLGSGVFYPLDEWLKSQKGKEIYSLYDEEVWEGSRVDGKIYGFPNEGIIPGADKAVAFNKKYIPSEEIKQWDGSLEGLLGILNGTKIGKEDLMAAGAPTLSGFNEFCRDGDYLLLDDYFIDLEKGEIVQPFEIPGFYSYLSFWHTCAQKGYTGSVTMGVMMYEDKEQEAVDRKSYVVEMHPADNIQDSSFVYKNSYKKGTFRVGRHIGTMTGISKYSSQKEECLELMAALRTDDELANLLVWGGCAENVADTDGYAKEDIESPGITAIDLGLYDGVVQERGGSKPADIRKYKKEQLASNERKRNPWIGFEPDYKGLHKEMERYLKNLRAFENCWQKKDFEKEYRKASGKMGRDSKKLMEELNKQLKQVKRRQQK